MRPSLRLAIPILAALLASAAAAEPIGRYFYVVPFGGYKAVDWKDARRKVGLH